MDSSSVTDPAKSSNDNPTKLQAFDGLSQEELILLAAVGPIARHIKHSNIFARQKKKNILQGVL